MKENGQRLAYGINSQCKHHAGRIRKNTEFLQCGLSNPQIYCFMWDLLSVIHTVYIMVLSSAISGYGVFLGGY